MQQVHEAAVITAIAYLFTERTQGSAHSAEALTATGLDEVLGIAIHLVNPEGDGRVDLFAFVAGEAAFLHAVANPRQLALDYLVGQNIASSTDYSQGKYGILCLSGCVPRNPPPHCSS